MKKSSEENNIGIKLNFIKFFTLSIIFTIGLILGTNSLTAQDKTQIAVLELKTVFDKYYKSIEADKVLKAETQDAEKELKKLQDDLKKNAEELKELGEQAQSPILSTAEKQAKGKEFQGKRVEFVNAQKNFLQKRQTRLSQIEVRRRDVFKKTRDEVMVAASQVAKEKNIGMVFDASNPVLLFASDNVINITQDIITLLNKDAPKE